MTTLLTASNDGIRQWQVDLAAGTATQIGELAAVERPLAMTVDGALAWTVALTDQGAVHPVIAATSGPVLGPDGPSGGEVPCHIAAVDDDGHSRTIACANYTGATVGVTTFTGLNADNLAETAGAQLTQVYDFGPGSNPHQIVLDGGRLLVTDLGLNRIHILDLALPEPVAHIDLAEGDGPRNLVAVSEQHWVVALEHANGAALVRVDRNDYDQVVGGKVVSTVRFAGAAADTHPSQILRLSDGRVAILNRGSQQLCLLTVDGDTLNLEAEHPVGAWPMDLVERDGVLLIACRDEDVVIGLEVADLPTEKFRFPVPTPNALGLLGSEVARA